MDSPAPSSQGGSDTDLVNDLDASASTTASIFALIYLLEGSPLPPICKKTTAPPAVPGSQVVNTNLVQ